VLRDGLHNGGLRGSVYSLECLACLVALSRGLRSGGLQSSGVPRRIRSHIPTLLNLQCLARLITLPFQEGEPSVQFPADFSGLCLVALSLLEGAPRALFTVQPPPPQVPPGIKNP
jgi:hypothetical protein